MTITIAFDLTNLHTLTANSICFISVGKYHLRFNENRKFHELTYSDLNLAVNADQIDKKLSGLKSKLLTFGEIINEINTFKNKILKYVQRTSPILNKARAEGKKILFEGAGDGHGFAAYPYGEVADYALNWLKYQILDDTSACESLLEPPSLASQYFTNIECRASIVGDINGDTFINVQDVVLVVNLVLSTDYDSAADINSDGIINVLDIVQVVNIILS